MRASLAPSPSRIIPAYAGSTGTSRTSFLRPEDHPRIRGEHPLSMKRRSAIFGSSPHTRGAPLPHYRSACRIRISPAYAGSTPLTDLKSVGGGDHPRIRGEHDDGAGVVRMGRGSSPHTRGARFRDRALLQLRRIIPAYAGSTSSLSLLDAAGSDHPRIRGEHRHGFVGGGFPFGSSPHTRGAHGAGERDDLRRRIIPAYAGSTSDARVECRPLMDHPRIRGEHGDGAVLDPVDEGSSPHTRGARHAASRR